MAIAASGQIAFVSDRDHYEEIYVMSSDGSGVSQLTNAHYDHSPAWSPDGAKLAFVSTRDGHAQIYLMNADGSGVVRLTNDPGRDFYPHWSPDGTKIAFASDRDGNLEIYVMNVDGSSVTRLTNDPASDQQPAWSPDGARIAFVSDRDGNTELYVMDSDGSGVTRLTNAPDWDDEPAWSPGPRILFASHRDGNWEVYSMNADGSGISRLTDLPATASLLTSGSQDFTAMVTNDPSNRGVTWSITGCSGGPGVCGSLSKLTSTRATYAAPATVPPGTLGVTATSVSDNSKSVTARVAITAIAADGQIAFISDRDGSSQIYLMNADGSGVTRLTNSPAYKLTLVWSPDRSE